MPNKKSVVIAALVAYFAYRFYNGSSSKTAPIEYAPVIETANGPVRGIVSLSRDGRSYHEYRGLPYGLAERFEPPQAYPDKWTAPQDASQFGAECIQMGMLIGNIDGEEDCLFLNVNVPQVKKAKDAAPLPTLVFIHGGHFTEGAGHKYLPDFLVDEDMIVVTINYRLGVFGFLNTGDGVVRGNMGLKDQNLALRWIQSNIAAFGGDPKQVTLSGESAGSVCTHLHVLSPLSAGLFQRAIAMSGTSLGHWAITRQPKEQAIRFGKRGKCPTENSQELVKCLRKIPARDLVALESDMFEYPRNPMSLFVPSIEAVKDKGTFLGEKPEDVLRSGKFNKVPYLTGVNSEEGLIMSAQVMAIGGALDKVDKDTERTLPPLIYLPPSTPDSVTRKIRAHYFGEGVPINTRDKFQNYTSLASDRHFFHPLEQAVRLQASEAAPMYLYYFTYPTEFSLSYILLAIHHRFPPLLELLVHLASSWAQKTFFGIEPERHGICHADELALFFNMPGLTNVDRTHRDYAFSKKAVKLWADFVYGRKLEFGGVKWEPVRANEPTGFKYLHIEKESKGMIVPPFRERLKFWDELNLKQL